MWGHKKKKPQCQWNNVTGLHILILRGRKLPPLLYVFMDSNIQYVDSQQDPLGRLGQCSPGIPVAIYFDESRRGFLFKKIGESQCKNLKFENFGEVQLSLLKLFVWSNAMIENAIPP